MPQEVVAGGVVGQECHQCQQRRLAGSGAAGDDSELGLVRIGDPLCEVGCRPEASGASGQVEPRGRGLSVPRAFDVQCWASTVRLATSGIKPGLGKNGGLPVSRPFGGKSSDV